MTPGHRGSVLIGVLWLCALIAWIGFSLSAQARMRREADLLDLDRRRGLYLALGGIQEAVAVMVGSARQGLDPAGSPLVPDGPPWAVEYSTGLALVRVESESDKVNVNRVSPDTLRRELALSRLPNGRELTELIIDSRSRGQRTPALRAKSGQTRAGPGSGPESPPWPLRSLDQLLLIKGIGPEAFYGDSLWPGKDKGSAKAGQTGLFELLTVHGGRVDSLQTVEPDGFFRSGRTYRVISTGMVSDRTARTTVWAVVRISGASVYGYDVLYRKII